MDDAGSVGPLGRFRAWTRLRCPRRGPGAPWPVAEWPADELEGALTSAHELEAHLGQLGEGPARRHVLEGKARVHHLDGCKDLGHDRP